MGIDTEMARQTSIRFGTSGTYKILIPEVYEVEYHGVLEKYTAYKGGYGPFMFQIWRPAYQADGKAFYELRHQTHSPPTFNPEIHVSRHLGCELLCQGRAFH